MLLLFESYTESSIRIQLIYCLEYWFGIVFQKNDGGLVSWILNHICRGIHHRKKVSDSIKVGLFLRKQGIFFSKKQLFCLGQKISSSVQVGKEPSPIVTMPWSTF